MFRRNHQMQTIRTAAHEIVNADAMVTSTATWGGMGGGTLTSVVGWLMSDGAVAFIGVAVTVLGFIVNHIFQIRRDRREIERDRLLTAHEEFTKQLGLAEEARRQEMHKAQLAALAAQSVQLQPKVKEP